MDWIRPHFQRCVTGNTNNTTDGENMNQQLHSVSAIPIDIKPDESTIIGTGMREGYLPPEQRKKILFLCDDIRLPSGCGIMGKELIMGMLHRFHFVNLAAGIAHNEAGSCRDASQAVEQELNIPGAYLKLYPYNGYGDAEIITRLLAIETPDVILHLTDPRYFLWLYQMRDQIEIPICYYALWDDLPYPRYNRDFYRSSDAIFGISKQSFNLHNQVLGKENVNILDFNKDAT